MIQLPLGTQRMFTRKVTQEHIAQFDSGIVHPVCSTFQIAKDAEWVCRLFVLEMKEAEEEGIGTYVEVHHDSPALIDSEILFTATLLQVERNLVVAEWKAEINGRLVAHGTQHQKILPKHKIDTIFGSLKS